MQCQIKCFIREHIATINVSVVMANKGEGMPGWTMVAVTMESCVILALFHNASFGLRIGCGIEVVGYPGQ